MTALAEQVTFDADTYLAWEREQTDKHEYLNGEVFAFEDLPLHEI